MCFASSFTININIIGVLHCESEANDQNAGANSFPTEKYVQINVPTSVDYLEFVGAVVLLID